MARRPIPSSDVPEQSKPTGPPSLPVLSLRPTAPPKTASAAQREPPPLSEGQSDAPTAQRWWLPTGRQASSCLASCLFHATLLILLALIVEASGPGATPGELTAYTRLPVPSVSPLDENDWQVDLPQPVRPGALPAALAPELDAPQIAGESDGTFGPSGSLPPRFGPQPSRWTDWLLATDALVGGGLAGRGPEARARLAGDGGGNDQSEAAVERGLKWLIAHQLEDGSWHFDHHRSPCRGLCGDPGTEATTTGATAMALLAFLGAGYTHVDGEYQHALRQGIYYLGSRARTTSHGADLQEGTMYAQGLAAIALCEAYAMTDDRALLDLAQGAIDFIDYAQDKEGGGWRYAPQEPGDTTVTGWQMMALKSGQMARLHVPSPALFLGGRFLDSVQNDGGAQYGYMTPEPRRTTTAVGLLCRMYTGYRRSNPALRRGVAHLSQWGPSEDDIYYDYYATQVMHHWGGSDWVRWNRQMRDYLIATQATVGHESGSWHFSSRHADAGGRLFSTATAVMILEVYYRYMPLYGDEAFTE